MWGEKSAYRTVGRLLKKIETPGSKRFARQGMSMGVTPSVGAQRWAEMGAVSITASYLLRIRRGIDRETKYQILVDAYLQRAQNFLIYGMVTEASQAQMHAWTLMQAVNQTL